MTTSPSPNQAELQSRWLVTAPTAVATGPALRVFCFDYAGGGASTFMHWAPRFPTQVQLVGVQLPGREARRDEPLLRRMDQVVNGAAHAMRPLLDRPFAFLGYSSGAVIAFAVARLVREAYGASPELLIVGGQNAPHVRPSRIRHALPDDEFVEVLRTCDGTPDEVLNDEFVMALMLPCIRADGEIVETYHCPVAAPFSCPISLAYGEDDSFVDAPGLRAWQEHSAQPVRARKFPGGHLFLREREAEFIAWASDELGLVLPRLG